MTIVLQEGESIIKVVLRDGTVIKRAEMREYTTSDGRTVIQCGNCNRQLKAKKHVIDKDGILSEWGA